MFELERTRNTVLDEMRPTKSDAISPKSNVKAWLDDIPVLQALMIFFGNN
jgi:hypothetical protein